MQTSNQMFAVSCGVPQGYFLGPLLFSIHINDLSDNCTLSIVCHYAADTSFWSPLNTNQSEIQQELNINNWLVSNHLSLNRTKKESQCSLNKATAPSVQETEIEFRNVPKYLGVYIDKYLPFVMRKYLKCSKIL